MSSFVSSGGQASTPQNTTEGDGVRAFEAFYVAASLMAVLICLVVVRFLVIALIDVFSGERYSTRYFPEIFRKVCPWWHRRTLPAFGLEVPDNTGSRDGRNTPSHMSFHRGNNKAALHATESHTKQNLLVAQLLPCHALRSRDLEQLQSKATQSIIRKPDEVSSDSIDDVVANEQQCDVETGDESSKPPRDSIAIASTDDESAQAAALLVCCSICLQELSAGQLVCKSQPCGHWFHAECLRPWVVRRDTSAASHDNTNGSSSLSSSVTTTTTTTTTNFIGNNHCPNCRASIVPQQALDNILGALRRHELSRER